MNNIKDRLIRNIKLLDIVKALGLSFFITGMIHIIYKVDDLYITITLNAVAFALSYYVFIFEMKRRTRERISIENIIKDNNQKLNDSLVRMYYNIGDVFSEKIFDLEKLIVNTGGTIVENIIEAKNVLKEHEDKFNEGIFSFKEELTTTLNSRGEELSNATYKNGEAIVNALHKQSEELLSSFDKGFSCNNETNTVLSNDLKFLVEKIIDITSELKKISGDVGEGSEYLGELFEKSNELYSLLSETNSLITALQENLLNKADRIIKGSIDINDNYIQLQNAFSQKLLELVEQNNHVGNVLSTTVKTLNNVVNRI